MSIGKVLGGTVIATPAVGGGGYVIYKEVTKEEAKTDAPKEQTVNSEGTTNNVVNGEKQPQPPVERNGDETQGKAASPAKANPKGSVSDDTEGAQQEGRSTSEPGARAPTSQSRPGEVTSSGSSGSGDGSSR